MLINILYLLRDIWYYFVFILHMWDYFLLIIIFRYLFYVYHKENKITYKKILFIKITIISITYFLIIYSIAELDLYWVYATILNRNLIEFWTIILIFPACFFVYFFLLNIFTKKEIGLIFIIQGILLVVLLILAFYFDIFLIKLPGIL